MKKLLIYTALTLLSVSFASESVYAQFDIGVDFMSRYVWRGEDFGNSPSIQPEISYSARGFEVGAWAAIPTTGNPDGAEIDFFASYTADVGASSLTVMVTDYTFPEFHHGQYFEDTSHFVEAGIEYGGPDPFPITLFGGIFLLNDDDYSVYGEIGYEVSNVSLHIGFTPAKSDLYGTRKAGILSAGIGAYRVVSLSSTLATTLSAQVISNPYTNNAFFLFGISF